MDLKRYLSFAFAALLLAGCANFGKGPEVVLTGIALDINSGKRLVGKTVELAGPPLKFSPFGIPGPRVFGTTKTDREGRFSILVPRKYDWREVRVRFVDVDPAISKDFRSIPVSGWRIIDLQPKGDHVLYSAFSVK